MKITKEQRQEIARKMEEIRREIPSTDEYKTTICRWSGEEELNESIEIKMQRAENEGNYKRYFELRNMSLQDKCNFKIMKKIACNVR